MYGLSSERSLIVKDIFSQLGDIGFRSQFGGYGLWLSGCMFGVISEGEIYL